MENFHAYKMEKKKLDEKSRQHNVCSHLVSDIRISLALYQKPCALGNCVSLLPLGLSSANGEDAGGGTGPHTFKQIISPADIKLAGPDEAEEEGTIFPFHFLSHCFTDVFSSISSLLDQILQLFHR